MIETGVGVTVKRQVHIVSIDSDYFEDLKPAIGSDHPPARASSASQRA